MRRLLGLWLALMVALGMFTFAAAEAQPEITNQEIYDLYLAAEDNVMPICAPGEITLTIYTELDEYAANFMQSYEEHPIVKRVEEITGLDLKFIHPPTGDDGTFFNMTIASGDYPDIFMATTDSSRFDKIYPGGIQGAVQDKVLADNDALIRKYAKNYLYYMSIADKNTYRNTADDNGMLTLGTPFACDFIRGINNMGFITRKDMLDRYGLAVPKTIDELTAVMRTLKENGVEVPMALGTLDNYRYNDSNFLSGAFGVVMNGYQVDENGKVFYSRANEGYKAYLNQMASWYNEGLIDRDFVNRDVKDALKMFYNDRTAFCAIGNWQTTEIVSLGTAENPDFAIYPVRVPRLTDPEAPYHLGNPLAEGGVGDMLISATCKHPEAAVKLLDYLYNMDLAQLAYWGVGELEDGTSTYIINADGMHEYGDAIVGNPDWPYETIRHKYTLQIFQRQLLEEPERFEYSDPLCQIAWDEWGYKTDRDGRLPESISRTVEEDTVFTRNQVEIETYSDEMIYKFITGSLDVDAQWDSFVASLYEMGLAENEQIQQAAYERWLQR
ncbi:MAG: extracellular solute-binding protein [Candidatus Limiplasma sp.]|nr:extracellular solute-binding protein [Candidatus Limiplasma sp.]